MYKYNIILSNSDSNQDKELHLIQTMLGKQVDGVVFMSSNITDEHIEELKKSPVPVVLAGTVEDTEQIPSVNIDYKQAVMDAVAFFKENGHERIAVVTGPATDAITSKKIVPGYHEALEKAGLSFREDYVVETDSTYDSGIEALNQLAELNERPTAIYVCSDEAALGIIHAAYDRGIKIPEELEVISSDNTRLSLMVRPRLSTVVQPLYDIGAVSMRLLTKLMNKEEVEESSVILPHRLELRDSTKN